MFRLFKDKNSSNSNNSNNNSSSSNISISSTDNVNVDKSLSSASLKSSTSTSSSSSKSKSSFLSNATSGKKEKKNKNENNYKRPVLTKEERDAKLILNQTECFEIALQSMDYLLDDQAEKGYSLLSEKTKQIKSDLYKNENPPGSEMILTLATGVCQFLEATLGFEASMITRARATMSQAEVLALKAQQYNIKNNIVSSSYYPPGTVFKVTYTESCLLNALLMLFSESMLESAKALLKLKKAYNNLQDLEKLIVKANNLKKQKNIEEKNNNNNNNSIIESQSILTPTSSEDSFKTAASKNEEFLEIKSIGKKDKKLEGSSSSSSSSSPPPPLPSSTSSLNSSLYSDVPYDIKSNNNSSADLLKHAEKVYQMRDHRLKGSHIGNTPASNRLRTELGLKSLIRNADDSGNNSGFSYLNGDSSNSKPTVDEFIESGCDLCFGIIQVVLSLLPPAIGGVLSIIGFRGDREDGLSLIWRCVQERNIHGGLGLCALLFYYNGPFQFVDDDFDIFPVDGSEKNGKTNSSSSSNLLQLENQMSKMELLHPGKKLHQELLKARAVFPNSALWVLQEGAALAVNGKLQDAVEVMDSISLDSIEMRQVKSQLVFNRAIMLVHLHQYERAAEDFLYLLEINDWSHAFYTYFAGCCYLENYRMCQMGLLKCDKEKKDFFYERAKTLIYSAPTFLNTKKFMAKNLPFDNFMNRKVTLFLNISKKYNIEDPLDCIPISPINELTYLYNGYTRMSEKDLLISLKMVEEYTNPATELHLENQEMIKSFLQAVIYRRTGKIEKGCEILDTKIIPKIIYSINNGKTKFNKLKEDPWLYPATLYERALFTWKLENLKGLKECRDWLQRSLDYSGDYELSSRIGMKTKAALSRVQDEL